MSLLGVGAEEACVRVRSVVRTSRGDEAWCPLDVAPLFAPACVEGRRSRRFFAGRELRMRSALREGSSRSCDVRPNFRYSWQYPFHVVCIDVVHALFWCSLERQSLSCFRWTRSF